MEPYRFTDRPTAKVAFDALEQHGVALIERFLAPDVLASHAPGGPGAGIVGRGVHVSHSPITKSIEPRIATMSASRWPGTIGTKSAPCGCTGGPGRSGRRTRSKWPCR